LARASVTVVLRGAVSRPNGTEGVVAPGNMATVDVEIMGLRAEVAELAAAGDSKPA
jgi:hypothetical protein